jgi:hypothetical protein
MLKEQDNKCPGCGDEFSVDNPPHIDHCHRTGRVRGVLCGWCNKTLGMSQERPERLGPGLLKYLEDSKL